MTIGLVLTVVFSCLHWIDGASSAVAAWPTIYVFLPLIIECSIEILIPLCILAWALIDALR